MRATVNFEFGSEEIESFATNVAVKAIAGTLGQIAGDPAAVQGVLVGMQQMIGMVLSHASTAMHRAPRGRVGVPMDSYGGPMGPGPYGPMGPMQQQPHVGSVPYPYQQGVAGPGPQVLRPDESATVDRCFPIEATRNIEAGWACHGCATFNGSQRTVCRYCGHTRCDVPGPVVTPPPEPAPEVP